MQLCVYYDDRSGKIIEILPNSVSQKLKFDIEKVWTQEIPRRMLIALSTGGAMNASHLKEMIGHSMSTIHENVKKLEDVGIITTEVIYKGNKQRIISSRLLCVTRNPKHKTAIQKFFQGLWIDSDKTKQITDYLDKHPQKYFTAEEISLGIHVPVDEVELLLNNWDSQLTRGLSDMFKHPPFEKKVQYRSGNSNLRVKGKHDHVHNKK